MTAAKTKRNQRDRPELMVGWVKPRVSATPVDMSRARITVCPPAIDTRFAPAPGHVGEFSQAGIGRYIAHNEITNPDGGTFAPGAAQQAGGSFLPTTQTPGRKSPR